MEWFFKLVKDLDDQFGNREIALKNRIRLSLDALKTRVQQMDLSLTQLGILLDVTESCLEEFEKLQKNPKHSLQFGKKIRKPKALLPGQGKKIDSALSINIQPVSNIHRHWKGKKKHNHDKGSFLERGSTCKK